ncbi:MAG: glycerol-3-phosphate dehydrogenase/oxidase [Bacteroidetes bacterium]|nr:glycerol-3-phosphate dehydrogenase/oxidase [Bacteroidota bacterium]
MNFSNKNRQHFLEQLTNQSFDLLVIGGGITGCGIALDAALRGMKVALVEKNDFASGTSSRSTKLIHGGLRYLKQFELGLVHQMGRERAVVYQNARHLVIPEKMLLPIEEGGSLGKSAISLALLAYDFLAGIRRKEHRKMLDKRETMTTEPLLNPEELIGGGLYYEYRTDDARLTIEVAKSAYASGALLLNYLEAKEFLYDENKKIEGIKGLDKISGREIEFRATVVVNATGPWVDLLRKEDNSLKGKRLQLTNGVHLVVSIKKLSLKQAAYFDVGDGRMIFAIPRGEITYIGTTDTVYNKSIDSPYCTREDAQYLLDAVNRIFAIEPLQLSDIESTWAGLRPLIFEDGKSPEDISRKDEIIHSSSGLISIAGGKLTGYRVMAEKTVDILVKYLNGNFKPCRTRETRLSGGDFKNDNDLKETLKHLMSEGEQAEIPAIKIQEWFYRYGRNTTAIIETVKKLTSIIKTEDTKYDEAELQYCIEHEMVYHLNDYLIRRSGRLFFERKQYEIRIAPLAHYIGKELGLNETDTQKMVTETRQEFDKAVGF